MKRQIVVILMGLILVSFLLYQAGYQQAANEIEPIVVTEIVEVPVEVEKVVEVEKIIKVTRKPVPFKSHQQFEELMLKVSNGIAVLQDGQCLPVAQLLVEQAQRRGFYAETEILDGYPRDHAVVKGFMANGDIWLYDYEQRKAWAEWLVNSNKCLH